MIRRLNCTPKAFIKLFAISGKVTLEKQEGVPRIESGNIDIDKPKSLQ